MGIFVTVHGISIILEYNAIHSARYGRIKMISPSWVKNSVAQYVLFDQLDWRHVIQSTVGFKHSAPCVLGAPNLVLLPGTWNLEPTTSCYLKTFPPKFGMPFVRPRPTCWTGALERAQHQIVVADRWIHSTTTMMMRDDVTALCHKSRMTTKEWNPTIVLGTCSETFYFARVRAHSLTQ